MKSSICRSALVGAAAWQARSVAARYRAIDRAGSSGVTRFPIAAGVWAAGFAAVAWSRLGRDGRLPGETIEAHGWSVEAVLRGELRRTVTAGLLAPSREAVVMIVAGNAAQLYLLERLVGHVPALAIVAVGSVGGFLVSTGAIAAAARSGWPLAQRAAATLDFGPSLGTSTAVAALLLLMRHRAVTATLVGGLLVLSVAHRDIADAEHLIVFGSALAIGELLIRAHRATSRRTLAQVPVAGSG